MALFQEAYTLTKEFFLRRGSDVTTAGAINDATTAGTSRIRYTLATSITGFAGGLDGKFLTVTNANTVDLSIANESASSVGANRIITGTGGNITLSAGASIDLYYDSGASRWRVIGGTSGGFTVATAQSVSSEIILGAGFFQVIPVSGSAPETIAAAAPFGATPPLNGTVIRLIGTSNTNTLTIQHNDAANGCLLNGNVTLGRGSVLEVQYISSLARYVEISRNSLLGV